MKKLKEKEKEIEQINFSFGFKLVSKKPKIEEITELICTVDNHNKFYNIILKKLLDKPGYLVYAQYGKIGTTGAFTQADYHAEESLAKKAIKKLIEAKLKKGYIFSSIKAKRKTKKLSYV